MPKMEPAVRRQCVYILAVTVILSALMQAVFLVSGFWDYTVLLGNLWGLAVANLNFYLLAVAVTRAVEREEKEARQLLQASHSKRLFLQFLLALIGALIPVFHILAVVIPLLFPRVALALLPFVQRKRGTDPDGTEGKEKGDE